MTGQKLASEASPFQSPVWGDMHVAPAFKPGLKETKIQPLFSKPRDSAI
jgi:hypothetical protein